MPNTQKQKKIFIISGEASGDLLAGKIITELKKTYNISLEGIGGKNLKKLKTKETFPQEDIAIMGFLEVIPAIPRVLKRIKQTVRAIEKSKPDLIITVDSPDFCFRVIKKLKKNGYNHSKIIHIVAPTVWAYREKRAKKIAQLYDLLLVLFPFEPPYFKKHGLKTKFIGHPIIFDKPKLISKTDIFKKYKISKNDQLLYTTLGSRQKEISILSPIYKEALDRIKNDNTTLIIPTFTKYKKEIEDWSKSLKQKAIIITDEQEKLSLLKYSSCALAKSGTNNFEIAKASIPFIICYKVNLITYLMLKLMVKTKFVNLINILAQKEIITELIQYKCTSANISKHITKLLDDHKYHKKQTELQNRYLAKFLNNNLDPSQIAAKEISSIL